MPYNNLYVLFLVVHFFSCRIPGHDEISTTTELVFFQQAVIDRHVSGVTKNTSAEVRGS